MRLLGISRAKRFSPNSTARDAAIFEAVAGELRRAGHDVSTVEEEQFQGIGGAEAVFSMARSEEVLQRLKKAEEEGTVVVNSPTALLRGSRSWLTRLFAEEQIPQPAFAADVMNLAPRFEEGKTYWLKRGDACAQTAGDVRFTDSPEALEEALADFRRRGVGDALLSEHVDGDLVKFYGTEGTAFFRAFRPSESGIPSKFGLEARNGRPSGYAFSLSALAAAADRAARRSGFTVYGGDCIVRPDGTFAIIDFNDWPSFSPCRDEAATAIARRTLTMAGAATENETIEKND